MQEPAELQVLIVEDSALVRERLVGLAQEHLPADCICSVANGADAIAVFDRSSPDAVLLDLGLPDVSGLEVLEHIRRAGTSTEVVVFTNWAGPEMAARCHSLGANHFVSKAHDVAPIIEILRTITLPREGVEEGKIVPAMHATLRPEPLAGGFNPLSVLLVEDQNSQAEPLLKLLRRRLPQGSLVTRAASQTEAVQCVMDGNVDVVLLDLGLPDSEGVGAVVALRAASSDLAIIVLTARDDEGTVDSALVGGADDYLVKGELAPAGLARGVITAAKRKRAARALTRALDSRRRIMDSSADVICTLCAAGRFVEVGAASERVWGYKREEIIGRLWTQWIAEEERSGSNTFLEAVRRGATTHEFENCFRRKDGSSVQMRWSAVWSGTDRLMYCVARDITEQVTAQAKLEEQEEQYRVLFESNPNAMWVYDLNDLRILAANDAAVAQYGYSRAELLSLTLPALRPADERDRLIGAISAEGAAARHAGTWKHMRKDGSLLLVDVYSSPTTFEGTPARVAVLLNVTERKQAEAALRASEERFSSAFEFAPMGMAIVSLDGRWTKVNQTLCDLLGYSTEELIGKSFADVTHAETRERDMAVRQRLVAGELQFYHTEKRYLHKNGDDVWVLLGVSLVRDAEGEPLHFISQIQDISGRKAAEEALRKSEREQRELAGLLETERARLLAAQAVAKVGNWEIDLCTEARMWSAEAYRILEIEDDAGPSHRRFLDTVHPDDVEAVEAAFVASFSQYSLCAKEHRLLMPDGRIKFVEHHWQVAHDENGKPLRATGTIQDITARCEAQETLRESERNLALAQSVSHTGSWEILLDSSVADGDRDLHWSDEEFRIFGLEPGAVSATQNSFFELVHADDRERVRAAFLAAFESAAPYDLEHRITWPNGTQREVHERAEFLRDEQTGAVVKIIGTSQDVTERNSVERTLREQAEMLDLANDAIVVRRWADRVITYWNKGAEHLYGWTATEAIGRRIDDLLFEDQEHYEAVAKASEASGHRGEVRQVAKDGRALVVNAGATVIPNSDGTPRSVLIIQTDITEHKKLESQFLRAQRLESIGTLASGVAHDLNNVLAPILMSAPILRDHLTDTIKNQIVDTIEKSAERGAQIVKQVLTFARGVDGERVLLDPRHIIKEMAEIADQTFPKTIQVTTAYAEDIALVEGDPTQLHQVLLNLAVNARDAMPGGGKLVLSAANFDVDEHYAAMTPGTTPGPHVLINVSDTGSGIPAHVMAKMFDPFFTTKEIGKGTGLGLSTVLGIVKSHQGAVNAYSTPAGTTFRVLLPAIGMGELQAGGVMSEIVPGRSETILIVDDEPAIREVAQVLLLRNGYKVLVADDGPGALALFAQRQGEIALVLTDFLMPTMNGLSLARIIRKMNPAAKVIISSGRADDCSAAELQAVGIAASLTKPYTQATLLRTLQRVLHGEQAVAS